MIAHTPSVLLRCVFLAGLAAGLHPSLSAQSEWAELTDHLRMATGGFAVAALGDIDRDGRPDLLLAGSPADRLLRNTGNALFEDRTSGLPAISGYTAGVLFFDADGDGDPDLLRLLGPYATTNQDRLYLNDGKGVFTDVTASRMPSISANSRFAAAGDVNGDKYQDLVVASDKGTLLLLNNGKGAFADVTASNMPGAIRKPAAAELVLVDIDADSDLDLLMANTRSTATVDVIYTNDGKGKFTEATASNYKATWSAQANHVKVADFDGNSTPDMLLVDNFNFRLLSNDGKGIFTTPKSLSVPPFVSSPVDLVIVDIDADGDQDIALFHLRNRNQILRNDGNWKFTDITSQVKGLPVGSIRMVTAADIDGDNKQDLIYSWLNERPEIFLFEKANSFVNVTNHQTPKDDQTFTVARAADMNRDGALDLVTNQGLFLNDGRGIFSKLQGSGSWIGSTFSIVVADLDWDGDKDVYVGASGLFHFPVSPGQNQLLLNDGKGNLTRATATNLPGIPDFTNQVTAVDIDGDVDLDLLVANAQVSGSTAPSGIRILLNNRKAAFSDATTKLLPLQIFNTQKVLAGDINGDGRMDIVAVDTDRAHVYVQNKSRTFDLVLKNAPGTITNLLTGDLGDINGDGKPDLVLGAKSGFSYLINDGSGVFKLAPAQLFPQITDSPRAMDLFDVDDDGDLDVLMSLESGNVGTKLLINKGGLLQDATNTLSNRPFAFSFGAGDFDRDGDTDIVLPTNGGGLRMLLNLRRQLHAALPPSVGGRYVVDLHWRFKAASNLHAAILAFSPAAVTANLPGLGVLGIDTAMMLPLPARQLAGTKGALEYPFPVPNDARLKGLSVLAQAILATPEGAKLTNTTKSVVR